MIIIIIIIITTTRTTKIIIKMIKTIILIVITAVIMPDILHLWFFINNLMQNIFTFSKVISFFKSYL